MIRREFLAAAVVAIACRPVSAAAKKKKKSRAVIREGGEYMLVIVGDETRGAPGVARSGAATRDTLILPLGEKANESAYIRAQSLYVDALANGDRAGLEDLVGRGGAFRVEVGAKLVVLTFASDGPRLASLPATPGGVWKARVQDGPTKGAIVEVPARNLR
jgi:hypothetical protein